MAIYRTLYYTQVNVGVGGRITIPQELRDNLRLNPKDSLTVRVEETGDGKRQMVMWRGEETDDLEDFIG
jgi:bifunctional DNA-binding transcriptional regulator/antitoxin component of YhaV-PrlF toxin-antitoxin module|tara:strand:+ start:217 stop:423 length:207 start_codon:yes stop_codon:yes gene_type:complete